MSKRTSVVFMLLALLIPAAAIQAQQGPPDVINLALNDLSARLGETVTLADFASWTWAEQFYPDTSLGCPAPDVAYAQTRTRAYQFTFVTFENVTYDYRVSADGNILILCVAGQPVAPTPGPTPVGTPDAAVACTPVAGSGYLPARLAVGMEGTTSAANIPSNVRADPLRDSAVVFQIPGGGRFTVTGGPMCSGGLVWWQVQDANNRVGWVAEGEGEEYWLRPLSPIPTPTATGTPVATAEGAAFITVETVGRLARLDTFSHDSPVTEVAFVSDNLVAAGYEDGSVRLWEVGAGAPQTPLAGEGHAAAVTALAAVGPGAATPGATGAAPALASGDADGVVVVWDPSARAQVARAQAHDGAITALAFSVDGALLASAGEDGTVKLWNAATGTELAVITDFTDTVVRLAFNTAGTLLTTGAADGNVWVWGLPQP